MNKPHIYDFADGKQVVYICSPFRGDIAGNIEKARTHCKVALERGYIPYASHLAFIDILDDNTPTERETALQAGLEMVRRCNQLWVFGDTVTEGMKREIEEASARRIPIKFLGGQHEKAGQEKK